MRSYYDQLSIFGLYHAKDLSRKALTRLIEVNIIVFGKGNWIRRYVNGQKEYIEISFPLYMYVFRYNPKYMM